MVEQCSQSMQIAAPAKTSDLSHTDRHNDGGVAEAFARVDVAEMDFHRWQLDSRNCVADGIGIMGERARVDQNARCPFTRIVDGVDQGTLMVALGDA